MTTPFSNHSSNKQLESSKGFNTEYVNASFDESNSSQSNNLMNRNEPLFKLFGLNDCNFESDIFELDSIMTRLNDNSDQDLSEAIDFDEIAADIEMNDILIDTSTPTYELEFNSKFNESSNIFELDDFVCISNKVKGYLRYKGKVHFTSGIYCGIELDESVGHHDGSIENVRYFQCEHNHGIFAPIEKVRLVESIEVSKNTSYTDIKSDFKFKPIQNFDQDLYDPNNANCIDNEIKHILNKTRSLSNTPVSIISPVELNKTFDLITESQEMIANRLKSESKLTSGLVKPSAVLKNNNTSNVLGSKSTSSTCSTSSNYSSSSSSSSSSQAEKRNTLQFQMKLNKFNSNGGSNTSTPNNNKILNKQMSLGTNEKKTNMMNTNNEKLATSINAIPSKTTVPESALNYKSKLNQPSKLIKYTPASNAQLSSANRIPAQNSSIVTTFQPQQQQHLLKKQSLQHQQLQSETKLNQVNLFESKQNKVTKTSLGQIIATDTNLKQNRKPTSNESVQKNQLKTSTTTGKITKLNDLSNKLHSIPSNLANSVNLQSTSTPYRGTIDKAESIKVSKLSKISTVTSKNSSIPSLGVAKQSVSASKNAKQAKTMIAGSQIQKPIGGLKEGSSITTGAGLSTMTKVKKIESTKTSTSTPNRDKIDLITTVKNISRSSSNTSSTSRSSSSNTRPLNNLSQLKSKPTNKEAKIPSISSLPTTMNMYQPSISLLSRPIINTSNQNILNERNSQKSINENMSNFIIEPVEGSKMNETFDIDEDDLNDECDGKQDKYKIEYKDEKSQPQQTYHQVLKTNHGHSQIEENKRRSIQLIENNFEKMNSDHCSKINSNNLCDGFLEFEEIPDFLDDYMTETNTSNITVKNKIPEENNSLLDVDSFAQLTENSVSVNNNQCMSLKLESIRDSIIEENSVQELFGNKDIKGNNSEALNEKISEELSADIQDKCRIVLNDLIALVVQNNSQTLPNECQLVLDNIIDRIVSLENHICYDNNSLDKKETYKENTNEDALYKKQMDSVNSELINDEKDVSLADDQAKEKPNSSSTPTVQRESLPNEKTVKETDTGMQNSSKSIKTNEIKKSVSSDQRTRVSAMNKPTQSTQAQTTKRTTTNNVSPQSLSVNKVKRSIVPAEANKSSTIRVLNGSTDSSLLNKSTQRKSISKVAPVTKTTKTAETAKPDNDEPEKSTSSRKSISSRPSITKQGIKVASSISTSSNINKSSSSISSVKAASEKEPCTPSTNKSSSKSARANRLTNLSVTKQKLNNKENQSAVPKSLALTKIYKSRDGLAAVSSNTSIMSEVSNLSFSSKASLTSSIPTSNIRHNSISSATSTSTSKANNLLIMKQPTVTPLAQTRFQSSTPNKSSQLLKQVNASSNGPEQSRKTSLQLDGKSTLKKSGLQNSVVSNHRQNFEALSINTTIPSNGRVLSSSTASPSPSIKIKNEINLKNNEIKRLEALCESRTKELTVYKIKLRDTLVSFDAIAVAYKYLANDLNGFEVSSLRSALKRNKKTLEESIKTLRHEIDMKDYGLKMTEAKLEKLLIESSETKKKLETRLEDLKAKHESECIAIQKQTDRMINDIRQEKESSISRLNKMMETTKIENEHLVADLRDQLKTKQDENIELDIRIKECEETLAKDKDERIQRLIDIQHNLEKEIESLKTALDIKNMDLFDLRTKNNELTTKLDNFEEIEIKYRRYKQEMENLSIILQNKNEQEKRAAENNRMLAMKVEVKNKENQRLSMQNEQLQFRLQSQPNLSLTNNGNESFNLSNISISNDNSFFNKVYENENAEDYFDQCSSLTTSNSKRGPMDRRKIDLKFDNQNHSYDNTETPVVKLRSKSFKNQLTQKHSHDSSLSNDKKYSNSFHNSNNRQFRPVSETFNFDLNDHDFNEHNYEMTRSDILYDDNDTQDTTCSLTDACESNEKYSNSNSSSTSLLDSQSNEDQMTKSVPCMVLKTVSSEKMTSSESSNYNSENNFEGRSECEKFNSLSSSSISMTDHSVIMLE